MKESQQSTKARKSSSKHLQAINQDHPNIIINDVINEVATTTYRKKRPKKRTKTNVQDVSISPIGDEEHADLDSSHINHTSRENNEESGDEEVMVNSEIQMENFEGSKEIITPSPDLDDGIIKTTQNNIRE